jgi:hypothetical protein
MCQPPSNPTPDVLDIPPAKIKYNEEARAREKVAYPLPDVQDKGRVECSRCHIWLPFDQFESLTDPLCAKCRSGEAQRELSDMRGRMCDNFSKDLSATAAGRQPLEHIESFLAELMYDFGGMRIFVKEWSDQLRVACTKNPGSKTNLDQFRSIAKLVMDTNKLQHQEDLLDLSDEQLRVKKELALMQMLTDAAGDPHRRQMLAELIRSNGISLTEIPGLPMYQPQPQ